MKLEDRRYDIDWLRNLGILLLFPFHAARVFDYWDPFYVKNLELSWGLSWFITVTAYWFMPLLFYLAGASSYYALRKRTGRQYLQERVNRLLIPLLFGLFIIVPPQGYIAKLSRTGFNDSYIDFLKGYFLDFTDLSGYFGSFTPAHLWFILYLFVLSIIALPIFKFITQRPLKVIKDLRKPWVIIMLFVPLTLTEALPSPEGQNPFYYLFIFILGYAMCLNKKTEIIIEKYRAKILVFVMFYVPMWLYILSSYSSLESKPLIAIAFALSKNLAVWLTLIVILGYGKKYLSTNHKILSYMNKAAFPIYFLHQTVLVVISFYIVELGEILLFKYILIVMLTLVISLLLFEIFKRVPMMRWLLGIK